MLNRMLKSSPSFFLSPSLLPACLLIVGLVPAGQALAKTCELEISGNDQMQFDKKELVIDSKACDKVKLTLKHSGKLAKEIMGHNWVLAKTADKQAVIDGGIKAGPTSGYVAKGDAKVLAQTDLVGGGVKAETTFDVKKLKKGDDYTFLCTFPGHAGLMVGKFIVK